MKLLNNHYPENLKVRIIEQLNSVPFNTLFAQNVVNKKINGEIFVDNIDLPQTFYILHPYGMSLLSGKNNNEFNSSLIEYILNHDGKRKKVEWMQAYPESWHTTLKKIEQDNNKPIPAIEIDVRVNFKFNRVKYLETKQKNIDKNITIVRTGKDDFENIEGIVIPKYFWNNADDFVKNGIGYSLYYQDSLAAIAFSSVIDNKYLELGIETLEQFRNKKLAYEVCATLIDYCLAMGLEPVWACRKTNTASYKLAEKLGFEESLTTPYYKLNY
ncbi:MAG: GNAT family N-acetyltransferase [Tannerella sp.]|jgi:hypothetical protein|nr:GNAT family N-acetyltransferase [Tannerella sp.]